MGNALENGTNLGQYRTLLNRDAIRKWSSGGAFACIHQITPSVSQMFMINYADIAINGVKRERDTHTQRERGNCIASLT